MREQEPMTQTIKISEVKNTLSRLINQVYRKETRVLVEKSGIPVAAIISADDLQRFAQLEREREERFAVIDRMREAFKDVPPEEIEREAARSVAAARERRRKQMAEPTARSA
jgi:prevent-host-death family protein